MISVFPLFSYPVLISSENYSFSGSEEKYMLNRYHFTRHLSVIQNGYKRGEYEQQSIHRRI
jgi:hypothetical protein